jgi:hypothetical protein
MNCRNQILSTRSYPKGKTITVQGYFIDYNGKPEAEFLIKAQPKLSISNNDGLVCLAFVT